MSVMMKLKRSECVILPLVLKKKWYDMIASGKKREEYRDAKEYYRIRISNFVRRGAEKNKQLVVAFSLGMRKAELFMLFCGCKKFKTSLRPEWGEPNDYHYVISLGRRVKFIDESEASHG